MDIQLSQWIETEIIRAISKYYQNPTAINIFDTFIESCQQYYERPVHNLTELRLAQNTKRKGDIFEHFALKYLKYVTGLVDVWLLRDLPKNEQDLLKLKTYDVGIDLIGRDQSGHYYAIQAKYRRANRYKPTMGLSWKTLSTFYAMVNRTGPYWKHVVITNANYARHIGKKTKQDVSICLARLRSTKLESWLAMANQKGNQLGNQQLKPIVPSVTASTPASTTVTASTEVTTETTTTVSTEATTPENQSIKATPTTNKPLVRPTIKKAKLIPNLAELRALRMAHFVGNVNTDVKSTEYV